MSAPLPGRGSRLGVRALVVLIACILSSTSAGCYEWVPVAPAQLQARLQESGNGYVQVEAGDQSVVVVRAAVCQMGDSYVLSGEAPPTPGARRVLNMLATGCGCGRPPCANPVNADVTHSLVRVREVSPGGMAAAVVGVVLGAGAMIGLVVLMMKGLGSLGR